MPARLRRSTIATGLTAVLTLLPLGASATALGLVGDVLDDTTGAVDDTLDGTTDAVGDVLDGTTGAVGDVLDGTTGAVGDVLDGTTDTVDDVLDGVVRPDPPQAPPAPDPPAPAPGPGPPAPAPPDAPTVDAPAPIPEAPAEPEELDAVAGLLAGEGATDTGGDVELSAAPDPLGPRGPTPRAVPTWTVVTAATLLLAVGVGHAAHGMLQVRALR